MKTVYWDANVFHALFQCEEGRLEACSRIEEEAKKENVHIYTSSVTLVECLWIKAKGDPPGRPSRLKPEHEERIQKYFMQPFVKIINCDRRIAESARSLMWKYEHLRYKDAIHLATAMSQTIDILHSFDNDDLVRLNGKIGTPPLKICNPGIGDGFEAKLVQAQLPPISQPTSLPPPEPN
jgi:predicted nucleic acid-binding protein